MLTPQYWATFVENFENISISKQVYCKNEFNDVSMYQLSKSGFLERKTTEMEGEWPRLVER